MNTQLRGKRINEGWTLEYVGKQVGLTKTAIQAIETGKAKPSHEVMLKLCKLFNIEHKEVKGLFEPAREQQTQKGGSHAESPRD